MNKRLILFVLSVSVIALPVADALARKAAKKRVLVYSGKLLDDQGGPMGGVFPLTFALYNKARGGKSMWSESHYVAVENGNYLVELGRKKTLTKKMDLNRLYVGVRITGGPEIVRERFIAEGAQPEEIIRQAGTTPRVKVGNSTGGSGSVEYAEKAGYAFAAEKADNATRLDGLTLEQLKRKLGGGGSVKLGDQPWTSQSKGGVGGTSYELLCPEGYVMTGIRGGAGMYVDRLGIICSKLQSK